MTLLRPECRSPGVLDTGNQLLDIKADRIIIAGNALLGRCRAHRRASCRNSIAPWGLHTDHAIDDEPRDAPDLPLRGQIGEIKRAIRSCRRSS